MPILPNPIAPDIALAVLIGPEKQLSALPSIDGEDYGKLDLMPNTSWTIERSTALKISSLAQAVTLRRAAAAKLRSSKSRRP